jgi:hypothetical protein
LDHIELVVAQGVDEGSLFEAVLGFDKAALFDEEACGRQIAKGGGIVEWGACVPVKFVWIGFCV